MSRDTIYKYRRLLKIDNGVVKKTENKSYVSATKEWISPRYIFRHHSRFWRWQFLLKWLPKCIPRVFSYIPGAIAKRGAVINIRSVALIWADQERERQTDRPLALPWKVKKMTYGTYGCRICVRRAPRACDGRLVGAARADLYRSNA